MFTGLIQTVGTISQRLDRGTTTRLVVDPGSWNARFVPGASIAVDGCCLTLVEHARTGELFFDVIPETLAVTALGGLHPGHRVNLEQSVTPTTLLGGHIVQGHVDGVAEVVEVVDADEYRIFFSLPASLMPYLTPKGSISVSGVSMTLAQVAPHTPARAFAVALIPTTLEETNLGGLGVGDRVNIECDVLSKTVVHWLEHFRG